MASRLLPVALVLLALAADGDGRHAVAFYLLVASVPAAAVSALALFGRLVDLPGGARGEWYARLDAFLGALALVLLLAAAAVRGQAPEAAALPAVAAAAVVAALAAYAAQALTALVAPRPVPARAPVARGD